MPVVSPEKLIALQRNAGEVRNVGDVHPNKCYWKG